MANVVWPPTDMGREFDSRRLRKIFSIARAGDNTNGYYSVPLDTSSSSVWRGGGAEITVSKPTRFHELENKYFAGYISPPIRPLSQR